MLVSSWTYANKNLVANWPQNNSYWSILIQSGNILPLKLFPFWYPLASTMILSTWAQVPRYSILDPCFAILKVWSFDPCNTFKLGYRNHPQPTDPNRCLKIKIWNIMMEERSRPRSSFSQKPKTHNWTDLFVPINSAAINGMGWWKTRFSWPWWRFHIQKPSKYPGQLYLGMPNKAQAWMLHVGIYAVG